MFQFNLIVETVPSVSTEKKIRSVSAQSTFETKSDITESTKHHKSTKTASTLHHLQNKTRFKRRTEEAFDLDMAIRCFFSPGTVIGIVSLSFVPSPPLIPTKS